MEALNLAHFSAYLKPRAPESHKGDFGHVLVVGGEQGFSGAVCLAAEASLRVGAGLVSIATRPEHASMLNLSRYEMMCHKVSSPDELEPLLDKATAIVLGPGLGHASWGKELFNTVIESEKNIVLDADGLNFLAQNPRKKANWILTPHPGEAGHLLQKSARDVQQDRIAAIKQLQHIYGGVVVLKGAGSLVLGMDDAMAICQAGNPGMATAGMGDVLSGVIGSLLAQGVPLVAAAKLGVILHATAGDLAAKAGERGMIASDLMPYLRKLVNQVE